MFSLRTLMGAIVYVAIMFAALSHPSPIWVSVAFTLTVTCLLFFSLAAILSSNASVRGFAFFCWGYLLMWIHFAHVAMPITQPMITQAFIWVDNGKLDGAVPPIDTDDQDTVVQTTGIKSPLTGQDYWVSNRYEPFGKIMHLLICPIYGLIGIAAAKVIKPNA